MKKINKLKVRITLIWGLLTGKYKHFAFFHMDRNSLIGQLLDNPDGYDVQVKAHGLQFYNIQLIVTHMASQITPEDLMLEKAAFEAKAELLKQKRDEKNKRV